MDNSKPFFTVVIPVHNKGQHIQRSIESVLKQTFDAFELLLVNDASSDNSLEEMKKFTDRRIRILHRSRAGPGGYAARNLGLQEASGEWAAFLDADDEWYPEHLERMYKLSFLFPNIYFMGCGWINFIGKRRYYNRYFVKNKSRGSHIIDANEYLSSCLKVGRRPVNTDVVCIRLSSPLAPDLFPVDLTMRGGDTYAWLRMICYHKKLAWGAYLGAKYHRDSVNMVTKTAPASPSLKNSEAYEKLAVGLDRKEKVLLKRYFNQGLRDSWIVNIKQGHPNFNLLHETHWEGSLFSAFINAIIFIVPAFIVRFIVYIKRNSTF